MGALKERKNPLGWDGSSRGFNDVRVIYLKWVLPQVAFQRPSYLLLCQNTSRETPGSYKYTRVHSVSLVCFKPYGRWLHKSFFILPFRLIISVQFSTVAQSCSTLFDPMDCSTPSLPIHHQLPELTQIHVHQVSEAIQPSRPLLSPSSPAFNLSQHQGLFQWVSSSHQVAKVLGFSLSITPSNEYSGLIAFRMDGWISLMSKGLSRVFSNTTVQKHQFFGAQLSL